MRKHLILKLQGPLQAWGGHTFEGFRPSEIFPGRSALLGLLGACLGVNRTDRENQQQLANSFLFAVRVDDTKYKPIKMRDYHTVKNAREDYMGLKSHETIQTEREYWQDACYTVAIWERKDSLIILDKLIQAIKNPLFTPFLGRRSCALARPLFESVVEKDTALLALESVLPFNGTVYSEEGETGQMQIQKRDVPIIHQPRQFATRKVYVNQSQGASNVPE